jgi:hypothetical protein
MLPGRFSCECAGRINCGSRRACDAVHESRGGWPRGRIGIVGGMP